MSNNIVKEDRVIQQFTAPCTAYQNGISQTTGRTVIDIIMCLLVEIRLPKRIWEELASTAISMKIFFCIALGNETHYYPTFGEHADFFFCEL